MLEKNSFLQKLPVDKFVADLEDFISKGVGFVRVIGEVSNSIRAVSGHWYFNLRGDKSLIRCVLFRNNAQLIGLKIKNGLLVEVDAFISIYQPRGELQLQVKSLKPSGTGNLHLAFEKLKNKLQSEGLFDEQYKKIIPSHIKSVGVITSCKTAALQDVISVVSKHSPHVMVWHYQCAVQGDFAGAEIINAIDAAVEHNKAELLLIVRGGGSIEDLWCFNDEQLVRKIASCKIPIISGVGHETDFTLCDFVSDVRAPTPTAAAHYLPKVDELQNQVNFLHNNLTDGINKLLAKNSQHLDYSVKILSTLRTGFYHQVSQKLNVYKQSLQQAIDQKIVNCYSNCDILQSNINRCFTQNAKGYNTRINHLSVLLKAYDPLQPQKKGFALITNRQTGKIIKNITDININQEISAEFIDGKVYANISEIRKNK